MIYSKEFSDDLRVDCSCYHLKFFRFRYNLCSNRTPEALRRNFISKAAKLFKFHLFNKISISHEGSNVSVWSLIYRSTGEIEPRDEKLLYQCATRSDSNRTVYIQEIPTERLILRNMESWLFVFRQRKAGHAYSTRPQTCALLYTHT